MTKTVGRRVEGRVASGECLVLKGIFKWQVAGGEWQEKTKTISGHSLLTTSFRLIVTYYLIV